LILKNVPIVENAPMVEIIPILKNIQTKSEKLLNYF
jgi:hypothetical protein